MFDASVDDPLSLFAGKDLGSILFCLQCYAVLQLAQVLSMLLVEAGELDHKFVPAALVRLQGLTCLNLKSALGIDMFGVSLDQ